MIVSEAFCYGPFVKPIALPAEYSFNNCSFATASSGWRINKAMSRAFLAISTALAN